MLFTKGITEFTTICPMNKYSYNQKMVNTTNLLLIDEHRYIEILLPVH